MAKPFIKPSLDNLNYNHSTGTDRESQASSRQLSDPGRVSKNSLSQAQTDSKDYIHPRDSLVQKDSKFTQAKSSNWSLESVSPAPAPMPSTKKKSDWRLSKQPAQEVSWRKQLEAIQEAPVVRDRPQQNNKKDFSGDLDSFLSEFDSPSSRKEKR